MADRKIKTIKEILGIDFKRINKQYPYSVKLKKNKKTGIVSIVR